jgi:hypothetical protein
LCLSVQQGAGYSICGIAWTQKLSAFDLRENILPNPGEELILNGTSLENMNHEHSRYLDPEH